MRTLFSWKLLLLGLLAACGGDDKDETADSDTDTDVGDDDDDTDTDTTPDTTDPGPSVMENCPTDVGNICPYAGVGSNGFNGDGVDRFATYFSFPMHMEISDLGPPVMADWNNHKIRIMAEDRADGFTTIMGTDFLGDGDEGHLDGTDAGAPGPEVALNHPTQQMYFPEHCPSAGGLELAGNLLSASWHTHKLRVLDMDSLQTWIWAGSGSGWNGVEFGESADTVKWNQPRQVLIDSNCDVYVLDMRNERIRKLHVDTWTVDTIAGNGLKGYAGDGGDALLANFNFPKNDNPEPGGFIVLNGDETKMYVADTESHVIRVIDLTTGIIDLLAGVPLTAGDADGPAATAMFNFPSALAIDTDTNELFVADSNNHKVKVIDLETGAVSTFAGTGEPTCPIPDGFPQNIAQACPEQQAAGDGGQAAAATLYRPFGLDLDLDGNLVIADTYNHRYRIVYR